MAFTVTVKECGGEALTGATLGNGKCYTTGSSGTYTFSSCDHLAACAGNSSSSMTKSSSVNIPASGGTRTATFYAYGKGTVTFSTTGSTWSNTGSGDFNCPTTRSLNLTAGANTSTTSTVTYKVSASTGDNVTFTQDAAEPTLYNVTFPNHCQFEVTDDWFYDVGCSVSSHASSGGQYAVAWYNDPCSRKYGGYTIDNTGDSGSPAAGYVVVSVNVDYGDSMTQDCHFNNAGGTFSIQVNGAMREGTIEDGHGDITIDLTEDTILSAFYVMPTR